jgi:hypothetical protein
MPPDGRRSEAGRDWMARLQFDSDRKEAVRGNAHRRLGKSPSHIVEVLSCGNPLYQLQELIAKFSLAAMEALPPNFPMNTRLEPAKPPFQTILLYENVSAGKSARWFHERLARKFEGEFEFSHWMWNFAVLGVPQIAKQAADIAIHADQVILSAAGINEPPETVKNWLLEWAQRTHRKNSALVTLFPRDARHEVKASTHTFLRQIIAESPIGFFPESNFAPRRHRPE